MTSRRIGIVPLIAAGVLFMEQLDATVIVTALPAIAEGFGSTATSASLGVSAYMLAAAMFIPLSAWLADRWGSRTVLCWAIALFTVSSVLCGLAPGLWSFVALRVVQGAAAALMSPVARLVVVRGTAKTDLMHAIAVITWPALIAPVLGPPLGGFITTYFSWHWIFFINLPIGLAGVWLVWRFVPQQRSEQRQPLDWGGFGLMAGALVGLLLGLELLGGAASHWALGTAFGAFGLLLGGLAVRHVQRHPSPVFSLAALRVPSFSIATVGGGMLSRIAISATPFLLPLMFQFAFGLSPFAAGLMVLAYFLGNIGMKLFTTRIVRAFGFRQVMIGNGLALALTVLLCAAFSPAWPRMAMVVALVAGGAARSMQMTAMASLAYAEVPPEHTSGANTLSSLLVALSMTLGVSAGAFLLNLSQIMRGAAAPALADFRFAFIAMGLLGVAGLWSYWRLAPDAGAQVSGHRAEVHA